ncbi:MAG: carboxypeptidase regulatory-like domain-containing protein, partial [Thermoanaerobaculia bacterium]
MLPHRAPRQGPRRLLAAVLWLVGQASGCALRSGGAPGAVAGRVRFRGPVPEEHRGPIEVTPCGNEVGRETLVVSRTGGVKWAVVTIDPLGGTPAPSPRQPAALVLDNRECRFEPRVQVARPGDLLEVKNSDAVFHNVRALGAFEANLGLPGGAAAKAGTLRRAGGVTLVCDVHGWMRAHIRVAEVPHHAVTGPEGEFQIEPLPPGKHRLEVWHEALRAHEEEIEVQAGKTSAVEPELEL